MAVWPTLTAPSQLGGSSVLQKLVDGYVPTAADLNGAHGAQRWWQGGDGTADGCRPSWWIYTNSSFPSIASGTSYGTIPFTSGTLGGYQYLSNAYATEGVAGTRYSWVAGVAGMYFVAATVAWPSNTTGNRMLALAVNGTVVAKYMKDYLSSQDQYGRITVSALLVCNQGDTITPDLWQNSGAALTPTDIQFAGTLVSF